MTLERHGMGSNAGALEPENTVVLMTLERHGMVPTLERWNQKNGTSVGTRNVQYDCLITNYQLPITDYQLPIPNYQLPIR